MRPKLLVLSDPEPLRDPDGRLLSDYCLADDRAIRCTGDIDTLEPFIKHIAKVLGIEVKSWYIQNDVGLIINGKHVRLDLLIVGEDGTLLDFEPQKSNDVNLIDRLTAYSSWLNLTHLGEGFTYDKLPKSVSVFLCQNDITKRGKAVDVAEMAYRDDGKPAGAKFKWIILTYKNLKEPKTELEWLLHDFYCKDPEKMHSQAMANRLKYLQSSEGLKDMFLESREEEVKRVKRESLAEGQAKGEAIGLAKGEAIGQAKGEAIGQAKAKENAALGLLKEGLSAEIIARALDLHVSEVHAITARHGIALP